MLQAAILDAYCPHLGAHLGYGGTVQSVRGVDCIRCPFHHWCFSAQGDCIEISYTDKKIPSNAKVHAWPTMEWAGRVCFYYHPDKEEPAYLPPDCSEWDSKMCQSEGLERIIRTHVCEVMENCSDPVHFQTLHCHAWLPIPFLSRFTALTHHITCSEKDYFLDFGNKVEFRFCGYLIPSFMDVPIDVHVTFVGLTLMVFRFKSKKFGATYACKSLNQVAPTVIVERDIWYKDPEMPYLLFLFIKAQAKNGFEEDFLVWEHKICQKKPLVVSGDGAIMRRRRWMIEEERSAEEQGNAEDDDEDEGSEEEDQDQDQDQDQNQDQKDPPTADCVAQYAEHRREQKRLCAQNAARP
ncbi:hypothetical protein CYMTET_46934 [Cymbomonas tetramitiformis]|uniref:cholesterol 7-desaturase n=1 Tax=Cymbomonas tetramitiformis TaxID=36881 RepID=A0AAE0BX39_9CHLO|nr:hypothetical protein CYMTET_46934 [Cymbomonas tetramitiformis]